MRLLLLFFFFFCAVSLAAQNAITGRVADADGQALAFVTILLDDQPGRGVLSDIEGRFSIGGDAGARSLTFRYVGFQTKRLDADFLKKNAGKSLYITLQPSNDQLPEAVITAGENPADRLIRKAIAHRDENNPEKRPAYRCKTYNKIVFETVPHRQEFEKAIAGRDTAKKEWNNLWDQFHKAEQQAEQQHLFLMESVTERLFKFPNAVQERVLLNRVSGLQSAGLVALANMVQPFSCYGDFLRVLDKDFVNPVSPGSPKLYFFNIEDTLYSGADTVWILSFHPRKGRVFEGLEGVIHLNSHGWAVQNLRARPADRYATLQIKIEQSYQQAQDNWFPEQLNFELEFDKYPSPILGLRAAGRSYVADADTEAALKIDNFDPEMPLVILPSAVNRTDSAWQRWRDLAPLNPKELRTYTIVGSIGRRKNFDKLARIMDFTATGLVPLCCGFSADLTRFLKFNDFEGTRIGAGVSTAQNRPLQAPRRIETGAWAGYGTHDKTWKYGGYGIWRISRGYQTQLRAGWSRDLLEPGALHELRPAGFVNRTLYARRMDYATAWTAVVTSRPTAELTLQAGYRRQELRPGYDYRFIAADGNTSGRFAFQEATGYVRLARGEQVQRLFGSDLNARQPWPVLEVGYTRGWGNFKYHRWAAALYQSVMIRRLGRADWRIEAGHVTAGVPLAKLFMLNQGGGSFGALALGGTFQALPDTLLVSDRFINCYFSQAVGHIFYRSKYSSPFLTLVQNAAWGDLQYSERHKGIGFTVAARPYLESGIRLDHLVQFNYVNIGRAGVGFAAFYRWGILRVNEWQKNVAIRLTFRVAM